MISPGTGIPPTGATGARVTVGKVTVGPDPIAGAVVPLPTVGGSGVGAEVAAGRSVGTGMLPEPGPAAKSRRRRRSGVSIL